MLIINLKRVMRLRGVEKRSKLLVALGMAPATARNFLAGDAQRIQLEHLEKICLALNCTPNDLFEWHPSPPQNINPETRALNKLNRQGEDLGQLLGSLPLEKFEQIMDIMQELKDK